MPQARMLLLLAVFVCSATADTQYLIKTAANGHESIVRQYFRGKDMRMEDLDASGDIQSVTIVNSKRRISYHLTKSRGNTPNREAAT